MPDSRKKKSVRQADSADAAWLTEAIGQATKSSLFCVDGHLPGADPQLEVEGLGPVRLPLKSGMAKKLVACCEPAPYGKGAQTLIDEQVRKTFELDPKSFRLGDAWNEAVAGAVREAAESLGLPADRLEARLYKLLVYERGGFFLPHRDSEKHDRMVASLIVVLPNTFEGGRLVVRHGNVKKMIEFKEAATATAPCYAAFYADCEHEVKRVTYGVRVCLAYNLVLKPQRGASARKSAPVNADDPLSQSIRSWTAKQPATPLVIALDHHYTERGLSLDLLKGADRRLADLVAAAAEKEGCLVHLAQVKRHLSQFADDGSFGYAQSRYSRYGYRAERRPIEIGETYEDDLEGSEWTDLDGKKQPWGAMPFDLAAVVSSTPINDWKPTTEEYEGYTGNAGNTLDRWYHRSALVVWRRDHHYEVVAGCGADASVPLFRSMASKLAKTPKKRLEAARGDCLHFARAIIDNWPREYTYSRRDPDEKSPRDDFPASLLALHDRETVVALLARLAEQDQVTRLDEVVVPACREFGWEAFASELKRLITVRPDRYGRADLPSRDVEWLCALCCDPATEPDKQALTRDLCTLAVDRFCEPFSASAPNWRYEQRDPNAEKSFPMLIKALAAGGREEDLSRALQFVEQTPRMFSLDNYQVPALRSLIPWSRKQFGSVPPLLSAWLDSVRRRLESATARKPAPPTDWVRPSDVPCDCADCAKLRAFLADPASEVGRIPAAEYRRQHVLMTIQQHQSDVTDTLERKGSPYSLVLTKTTGSFKRALKRYEMDCDLLAKLPSLS